MEILTVFTPTYNRADLLYRCYESLKAQTCKDFIWLIIDDGSTDNTRETVSSWIESEKDFKIDYKYKENGGLYTAYNTAISFLKTELAVCIDSDDFMPEDGVKFITDFWRQYGSDRYAGIVGLDYTLQGEVIGDPLPDIKSINLIDVAIGKYNIRHGDRKLVVRSELYKEVAPMPVFKGEKHFNPNYMHMEISFNYDFLVANHNLCYVDYQPDGMSSNIFKQYYSSPNSFAELRKQHLRFPGISFRYKCKEYIHYISSCFLAGKDCGLRKRNWILFILLLPFGALLSIYVRIVNHRS